MHKQHPQTAYCKDAVLIGTVFENCDNKDETPAGLCIHRLLPLIPFVRRLSAFFKKGRFNDESECAYSAQCFLQSDCARMVSFLQLLALILKIATVPVYSACLEVHRM